MITTQRFSRTLSNLARRAALHYTGYAVTWRTMTQLCSRRSAILSPVKIWLEWRLHCVATWLASGMPHVSLGNGGIVEIETHSYCVSTVVPTRNS